MEPGPLGLFFLCEKPGSLGFFFVCIVFMKNMGNFCEILGILSSPLAGLFLRRFRDPLRVTRISNRVPRIRENYHRVPKTRENRVPRIREIGSLQIHTGCLTFFFKKNCLSVISSQHLWEPSSANKAEVYNVITRLQVAGRNARKSKA